MNSKIETIDRDTALHYLSMSKGNRRESAGAINKYANDMKMGLWQLSPQGIAFNEDGVLVDGHTRLKAIVKANVPVEMYVTRDVPRTTTEFDRQVKRTVANMLQMYGVSTMASSNSCVGAVNFLYLMAGVKNPSDSVVIRFVLDNEQMLASAYQIARTKSDSLTKAAPFISAIYSALYCGLNEQRLYGMFGIVNSGFTTMQNESAAIVLRNHILSPSYKSSNETSKRASFVIATRSIADYFANVPRTRQYKPDGEPVYFSKVRDEQIIPSMAIK